MACLTVRVTCELTLAYYTLAYLIKQKQQRARAACYPILVSKTSVVFVSEAKIRTAALFR